MLLLLVLSFDKVTRMFRFVVPRSEGSKPNAESVEQSNKA